MVSLPDDSWWQTDYQASPDHDVPVVDPWDFPTPQSASSQVRSRETNKKDGDVANGADTKRPRPLRNPNEATDRRSTNKPKQETTELHQIIEQVNEAQISASDLSPSNYWREDGELDLPPDSDEFQPIDFDSFQITNIITDESTDFGSVADFDHEARQSPWKEAVESDELADSRYFIRANEKAAEIVDYFEYKTSRERDDAYRYLVEFFSDHSHNKTFESIRTIALTARGKSPDFSGYCSFRKLT